jgi:hypothetical protein
VCVWGGGRGAHWPLIINATSKIVAMCEAGHNFSPQLQSSILALAIYHAFVATPEMGHWHCLTTDNSLGKLKVRGGYSWILHVVDRGKASSQRCSRAQKVLLAEHNMLVRSTMKDNYWQRQAIRLPYIQRFLPPNGGQSSIRLSLPISFKRSRGKRKHTNIISKKKILEDQVKGK